MKHFKFVIVVLFFSLNTSNGFILNPLMQKCATAYLVESIYEPFILGDTIFLAHSNYIPLNCDGDLKILEYYLSGETLVEKYYKGIKLIDTITLADPVTFDFTEKEVIYFMKTIPQGEWVYYHENGDVWKRINFDK